MVKIEDKTTSNVMEGIMGGSHHVVTATNDEGDVGVGRHKDYEIAKERAISRL